jgi:hypothetical protein
MESEGRKGIGREGGNKCLNSCIKLKGTWMIIEIREITPDKWFYFQYKEAENFCTSIFLTRQDWK